MDGRKERGNKEGREQGRVEKGRKEGGNFNPTTKAFENIGVLRVCLYKRKEISL